MRGWGGVLNGSVPVREFFDDELEGSRINELEFLAALKSLRAFIRFESLRSIMLVTDSTVTAKIVRNLTYRSPRLLRHFRTLRELCEANDVTIFTHHILSVLNVWAERLSRRKESTTWGLSPAGTAILLNSFRA